MYESTKGKGHDTSNQAFCAQCFELIQTVKERPDYELWMLEISIVNLRVKYAMDKLVMHEEMDKIFQKLDRGEKMYLTLADLEEGWAHAPGIDSVEHSPWYEEVCVDGRITLDAWRAYANKIGDMQDKQNERMIKQFRIEITGAHHQAN